MFGCESEIVLMRGGKKVAAQPVSYKPFGVAISPDNCTVAVGDSGVRYITLSTIHFLRYSTIHFLRYSLQYTFYNPPYSLLHNKKAKSSDFLVKIH